MKNLTLMITTTLLLSFSHTKKPVMIQDYKIDKVELNAKGQIVKVKYKKVGQPYIMPDSALNKTIHVIINN